MDKLRVDRLIKRVAIDREKLCDTVNPPARIVTPLGMHSRTYERTVARLERNEAEIARLLFQDLLD